MPLYTRFTYQSDLPENDPSEYIKSDYLTGNREQRFREILNRCQSIEPLPYISELSTAELFTHKNEELIEPNEKLWNETYYEYWLNRFLGMDFRTFLKKVCEITEGRVVTIRDDYGYGEDICYFIDCMVVEGYVLDYMARARFINLSPKTITN